MSNEENAKEIGVALRKIFKEVAKETLSEMPVWMKCNYLLNVIMKDGVSIEELNKNVNWDEINEILKSSKFDIDYNIFDRISSIEDLEELRVNSTIASVPEMNQPYYRKVCKVCGDEFTLTKGEVDWFEKKDLKLPCKCYYCRKKIQKPITQVKKEEKEEEPMKTAMQLALEKVGI